MSTSNYRVGRYTSGLDWSKDRYTYHRTYDQAFAAARAFMAAEGRYEYGTGRHSYVTIESRQPGDWWHEVNRWSGARPRVIHDGPVAEVDVLVKVPVRGTPGRYSVAWDEIVVCEPVGHAPDDAVAMAHRVVKGRINR